MLRRFHTYEAKPEEGANETVAELEDMRDIIANINPEVRPTDIMMALVLMDSVDHERYDAVKVQLNDLEDLTFRKVVEKYKKLDAVFLTETSSTQSSLESFDDCSGCVLDLEHPLRRNQLTILWLLHNNKRAFSPQSLQFLTHCSPPLTAV